MNDGEDHGSQAALSSHDTANWPRKLLSQKDWERKKQVIHDLYVEEDLPLRKVVLRMQEDHHFKATSRMFKSRLKEWGFHKNVSQRDWLEAAILWFRRRAAGKHTRAFKIHGRTKTLQDLRKHIKSSGLSEDDYVANALAGGVTVSDSIRAETPEPGKTEVSSGDSNHDITTSSGSFSFIGGKPGQTPTLSDNEKLSQRQPHFKAQIRVEIEHSDDRSTLHRTDQADVNEGLLAAAMPDLIYDGSSTDYTDLSASSVPSTCQTSCDHVLQDLGFMLVQTYTPDSLTLYPAVRDVESWQLVSPPDEDAEQRLCPKCKTPSRFHSPLPPDWFWDASTELPQKLSYQALDPGVHILPGSDEASVFQAYCYLACMYGGQQKYDLLAKSLQQADQNFEKMLTENNSMALLSVLLTLTVLHAHDQGPMAASIIRSAWHVSCRLLGQRNPLSLMIEWLTAGAEKKLRECHLKTPVLRQIHEHMQKTFGECHNNSIVTLYCLAFNLIQDGAFEEAETLFNHLYEICSSKLGRTNLQTVSALNGLSRAQTRQGKHQLAIQTLKNSLECHPLGPNHPFQLESMKRLAMIYRKIDRKDLMLPIYWAVLKGRIKTLGKLHTFTQGAKGNLEELLKDMGDWDAEKEERIQKLFDEGSAAITSDVESF